VGLIAPLALRISPGPPIALMWISDGWFIAINDHHAALIFTSLQDRTVGLDPDRSLGRSEL